MYLHSEQMIAIVKKQRVFSSDISNKEKSGFKMNKNSSIQHQQSMKQTKYNAQPDFV